MGTHLLEHPTPTAPTPNSYCDHLMKPPAGREILPDTFPPVSQLFTCKKVRAEPDLQRKDVKPGELATGTGLAWAWTPLPHFPLLIGFLKQGN